MLPSHFFELIIVLVIALVVFGPQRLPEVASAVGKGIREFRRATSGIEEAIIRSSEMADEDSEESAIFASEPDPEVAYRDDTTPTVDTIPIRRGRQRRPIPSQVPTESSEEADS